MCGITGIYAYNLLGKVSMINLARATESIAHRGPDFQNGFNDDTVGLGHRRLSIIDPSPAGHQPMSDQSGRYWLSYNGEIYNFNNLKSTLSQTTFHSNTDTEVLLNLLIERGTKCLDELEGFFSFAFYDSQKRELILAIDRFGIKPLYYTNDQDKFLFGSELRAILEYGVEKIIDHEALYTYFQLNYIPAPLTILKGIKKLLPGHLLRVTGEKVELTPWYTAQMPKETSFSYSEAKSRLRELMEQSVARRMVSDVPLGSFLSGGLDSSIIATLAKNQKEDLNTFSVGFSEERFFDETSYADLVANKIGTNHTRFDLTQQKFESNFTDILNHFDEPFADSSAIAYYLLSKETRGNSTVALSGDGADELFGGYNKHAAFMKSLSNPALNLATRVASPFLSLIGSSRSSKIGNKVRQIQKYATAAALSNEEKYWFLASITPAKELKKWLVPSFHDAIDMAAFGEMKDRYTSPLATSSLNAFLLADLRLVLPGDMLTKADRMSMVHGLEVRVPFLDTKLVEFALSLPPEFKIKGKERKRILYDTFKEDLPIELFHRPKKGFEVPLLKWLSNSSIKYEIGKLTDQNFIREQGIFDYKQIDKLVRSLKSRNPSDSHARVWALIVFQWWYRKYFM